MTTSSDCKHHPGQDCSCYCRFFGCSPRNCSVGEALEDEKPKPPKAEPFEPEMVLMPLDGTDGLILTKETRAWIASRLLKGDPGPLYVQKGEIWTEASETERAARQGVSVRSATDGEQREALRMEAGRRGLVLRVSDPVTGTTAAIRQAREEPMPSEGRSVIVLRRSGRDVEHITGTILSGRRGYVVRAEGVAVEVSRSSYDRAHVGVALVHRRVLYPGDEAAQNDSIEPHCELVGGACKNHGPAWDFYQQLEEAMEGWQVGEPPPAFWEILEGELIRWLEMTEKDW